MQTAYTTLILCLLCTISFNSAYATDETLIERQVRSTQMVQGGVGLIQTPTARMRDEGDFSVNYTDNDQYRFWSVNLQLFDWFEATARYTDVRTRLFSDTPSFSGDQTLKDKGLDLKVRLLSESYYLPEVSVGFRDFGGTGFFESEYVTASKAYGPFDFHLGLGWGYLGNADDFTNPFCEIRDSFCNRPQGFGGLGGKVDYDQFFKGRTAIFGGIEYQTPIEDLKVILEWEGNNYEFDRAGVLEQKTRLNAGLSYRWKGFDFSLNYQRGNTLGFGISYNFNMNQPDQLKIDTPPREILKRKPPAAVDKINRNQLYNDLYTDAAFLLSATDIQEEEATFYGYQQAYADPDESVERVARILATELPDSVQTYNIIEHNGNLPLINTRVEARDFIKAARYEGFDNDLTKTYERVAPTKEQLEKYDPSRESGFFYSTDMYYTQTFGSPESFYIYQLGLIASAGYAVNKNWSVFGGISGSVIDNYEKFTFLTDNEDAQLPRVRTRVREYVTGSTVNLESAFVNYKDQWTENVFATAYAGYLERMFGGIGGEVFYRPVNSNLALGVDLNYVKQRSVDDQFSFMDYDVITGHVSAYWRPTWLPDIQLTFNVGQFLAKDKGVNIDFAKRFDSGVIVGAFAAFTNVSSEEYGEGSFTKGFYISIPMDFFVLKPAKGRGRIPWLPISRDGGQMLNRPFTLNDFTDMRSPFLH